MVDVPCLDPEVCHMSKFCQGKPEACMELLGSCGMPELPTGNDPTRSCILRPSVCAFL